MRKITPLLLCFLLLASLASAQNFYDLFTQTMASNGNFNQCVYYRVNSTQNITVTNVSKHASATPTRCLIYAGNVLPGGSGNCVAGAGTAPLANGTFSGNTCMLNQSVNFTGRANYTIALDSAGSSWTQYYSGASQMPAYGNTSIIRYLGAAADGGNPDGLPRSLTGIYFNNDSGPAPPASNVSITGVAKNDSRDWITTNYSATITTGNNLTNCTFSTNLTGSWANDTPISITGTSATCTAAKAIPRADNGITVSWQWFACDNVACTNSSLQTYDARTVWPGVVNFSKYSGNPLSSNLPVGNNYTYGGNLTETSTIIENDHLLLWGREGLATYFLNASTPLNLNTNTRVQLSLSHGNGYSFVVKQPARWNGNFTMLMTDRSSPGTDGYTYAYTSSNGINWSPLCGGSTITPDSGDNFNPAAVLYNNVWTMIVDDHSQNTYRVYNGSNLCSLTFQGYGPAGRLNPDLGIYNDTITGQVVFVDHYSKSYGGGFADYWAKGPNMLSTTEQGLAMFKTQSWETTTIADMDYFIGTIAGYTWGNFYNGNQMQLGYSFDLRNRTFYEAHNVTQLGSQTLTLRAYNLVNGSSIPSFCANITVGGTGSGCTNTTLLNFSDVQGTLTVLFYNIGAAGTYYNQTVTASVTGDGTISAYTEESFINISAYKLFLNTSIASFNATNNAVTNTTTAGSILLPANIGTNTINVSVAGNYSTSVACTSSTARTVSQCNATGIFDNKFTIGAKYNGTVISTFTVNITNATLGTSSISVTNGSATFHLLRGYAYNVTIKASGYSKKSTILPANASSNFYNFTLDIAQAAKLHFYDELTREAISENISLAVISTSGARLYNVTTTDVNITGLDTGKVTLRFSADSYPERDYYLSVNDESFEDIDLYMITFGNSSTVLTTVIDTAGDAVENATVKLLRYYTYCNCYEVVEMADTSFSGQAYFNAEYYEGYYKWAVDYGGVNRLLSTTPENLVPGDGETIVTRTFTLNLGQDYYNAYTTLTSIGAVCGYDTASSTLSLTWSDPQDQVTTACIGVEMVAGAHMETYNNTCLDASTGGLTMTLQDVNNTRYKYADTFIINGTSYSLPGCAGWVTPQQSVSFGSLGVFLAGGVLITLVLIFSFSAIAVLVITAAGMILISWAGLMPMNVTFLSGFAVLVMGFGVYLMRQ